jgi:hypothetical protein
MLSQLDFKIFDLETIKSQYSHNDDFKDVLLNCKGGGGELGPNSSLLMGLYLGLTNPAFQLAL